MDANSSPKIANSRSRAKKPDVPRKSKVRIIQWGSPQRITPEAKPQSPPVTISPIGSPAEDRYTESPEALDEDIPLAPNTPKSLQVCTSPAVDSVMVTVSDTDADSLCSDYSSDMSDISVCSDISDPALMREEVKRIFVRNLSGRYMVMDHPSVDSNGQISDGYVILDTGDGMYAQLRVEIDIDHFRAHNELALIPKFVTILGENVYCLQRDSTNEYVNVPSEVTCIAELRGFPADADDHSVLFVPCGDDEADIAECPSYFWYKKVVKKVYQYLHSLITKQTECVRELSHVLLQPEVVPTALVEALNIIPCTQVQLKPKRPIIEESDSEDLDTSVGYSSSKRSKLVADSA